MKKVSIITLLILASFLLSAFLFSAKNQARAEEWPPLPVIIPIASIVLDGNPSDWSNIDTVYIDAEGDDDTDYTGADIKSFKFAQDSDFVYVMADFYDGVPNEDLGQAEPFAYQFHFTSVNPIGLPEPVHIDNLGVIYDGLKWDIVYLSLVAPGVVSGSLTGSSVAVGSVIELKVPKDKLPDISTFCLQIGTGLLIDGVLGDITEWRILSFLAERILPDKAMGLAKEVIGAPYHQKLYEPSTKGFVWEIEGYYFFTAEQVKNGYPGKKPGLDCSGLSFWSYNRAYYDNKHEKDRDNFPLNWEGANGQYKYNVDKISKEDLNPGDLLFFDEYPVGDNVMNHVVMYVGPFSYQGKEYNTIHASGFAGKIRFGYYNSQNETLTTIVDDEKQILTVDGYGRVIDAKPPEFKVVAKSPVDLIITDPDGEIITKEIGQSPTMEYQVYDIDRDGRLDAIVIGGERKIGDYLIQVVPEPEDLPTDTYSLIVTANDQTIILAEDVPISDIPRVPYIIKSTEIEIIPIVSAFIDFNPDTLNLKSRGKYVTTYIELPRDYDINDIDSESIELNSQVPVETKPIETGDYDSNGIPDLMVKFNQSAVQNILEVGDEVKLTLTGRLFDGTQFEGSDSIRVIRRGLLADISILLASLHQVISQLLNLLQNNLFIYD